MKIENEILYINKTDLDHILGYVEFDITEREKYINYTGEKVDDFILSDNFMNGLEIELGLSGLEGEIFNKIVIEKVWGIPEEFEMVPEEDKYPYDPYYGEE